MYATDFLREFDPHQYVLNAGWDWTSIEKTVELGVAEADETTILDMAYEAGLSEEEAEIAADTASDALLAYCKRRVENAT